MWHEPPFGERRQSRVGLLTLALVATVLAGFPVLAQSRNDAADRTAMIAESRLSYTGSCPCPYDTDRAGRRCGGRSAYSRPGGAQPLCYASDITDAMLTAWRARRR